MRNLAKRRADWHYGDSIVRKHFYINQLYKFVVRNYLVPLASFSSFFYPLFFQYPRGPLFFSKRTHASKLASIFSVLFTNTSLKHLLLDTLNLKAVVNATHRKRKVHFAEAAHINLKQPKLPFNKILTAIYFTFMLLAPTCEKASKSLPMRHSA